MSLETLQTLQKLGVFEQANKKFDIAKLIFLFTPLESQKEDFIKLLTDICNSKTELSDIVRQNAGVRKILKLDNFSDANKGIFSFLYNIHTRVGHADASADAHRMRINAHRCASSAYWAKNEIPFFTYKLPFWLR